jgi:hypothetical protein
MMRVAVRLTAMASLMTLALGAQAASVVVPAGTGVYNGLIFVGSGTLTFSADLTSALDVGKVSVSPFGAAVGNILKDSDGLYSQVSVSAPLTSLTIDTSTNQVLGAATTGGATQVAPVLKSVSSGGSLTVTDLNVDLANKRVYATLIGGNGVGTLTNFYLWDIGSVTGSTAISGPGTFSTTLSGLSITTSGFNKFSQSLGLLSLGKAALSGVTDFGTITSVIGTPPVIPEPNTYALMGLGLAGVAAAARRRAARAN